jgi:hypothetical protein
MMLGRSFIIGLLSFVVCALAACTQVTETGTVYLLYTVEVKPDGDAWQSGGTGCFAVDLWGDTQSGGSASGTVGENYSITLESIPKGVDFSVEVDGTVIEQRTFDEAFLTSGATETVSFTLPGAEYKYQFSSGPDCDSLEAKPE